ncbi:MAG: plasmid stabilization system-related protein [Parcubacteria group bacterium GW2011_GWB1_41_6]|nr:MAG: plasmid stabilization system-related protein [Parcubacteria group bacterium GW2011_GWB1_41_6]KKS34283.1 MAG: plasmid stabilization system-related protein [Parcubacteria group bacterium GW2011_GWC2_42_13]KKS57806.1 MAG: plasmid stabilization system-related protein [Parcubacteria group bacterium GW2011_GWA2_42_35]
MSKWDVSFGDEAESDLRKLNTLARKRIINKIEWLQENFDSITPLALGGEWRGFFKLRIGDWRVIYKIDWNKNKIIIIIIDHRTKIYKRRG